MKEIVTKPASLDEEDDDVDEDDDPDAGDDSADE